MGDPVTMALIASSVGSAAQGVVGYQQAKGEQEQAQINSHIGRTRAIQTDTAAREGLNEDLKTMRATFANMGQKPGVGTLAVMDEMRKVQGRDRRIEFGNRMQESADFRTAAKNAGQRANGALALGAIKAGPSLFDMYQYKRG